MLRPAFILLLALMITLSVGYRLDPQWKAFKDKYQKNYDGKEDTIRHGIWMTNRQFIKESNKRADIGEIGYWLEMNALGDLTSEEIRKKYLGLQVPNDKSLNSDSTVSKERSNDQLPPSIDWRNAGIVTKVKNQLRCGSCWAFAATGSLEGQHAIKTGKLISLSEQNLVACSQKEGNYGCEGGYMTRAFQYIKDNNGVDTEASYPYVGRTGQCMFNRSNVGATDTGFVTVMKGSEQALKTATALIGPIAAAIDADNQQFSFYKSGVLYIPNCSTTRLNYGLLVAGYGATSNGTDYWLLKISFGTEFGERGYLRLERNRDNLCGIATMASYPTL